MKAARLLQPGTMVLSDVQQPVPGANDLLVRVEAVGVCGSDRHMFKGEGVSRFRAGDRITGDPNIACGTCARCREGRPNLCEKLTAIGVFRDGAFADYVLVPEGQAYALPADLDPLHGVFCEPLACCLHGLDVARIKPGDSVAVLGGGVIGLLMVQLAKQAGATTVILSTRQKPRRDLALELGATHVVDAAAEDAEAQMVGPEGIAPGGVDVVLECAGVPETFAQGIRIARNGGALILFGVTPQGAMVEIEPYDLLVRELRIESAWLNPLTHERAAALVSSRRLELDKLITAVVPLAEVPQVVGSAPQFGEIKIIARP